MSRRTREQDAPHEQEMRRACAARLARGRRGGGGIALCGAHTRVADLRISQYIGLMRVNFSVRMRPDLPEVSFCSSLRRTLAA